MMESNLNVKPAQLRDKRYAHDIVCSGSTLHSESKNISAVFSW